MNACNASNTSLENCRFMTFTIEMSSSMLHEMVGEFYTLYQNRVVARKIGMSDSPSTSLLEESALDLVMLACIGQKRKKAILPAPECTSQVRRNTRSNKYNGFKPNNNSDTKPSKSKVKPRKISRSQGESAEQRQGTNC
jgi:hypothetical protein